MVWCLALSWAVAACFVDLRAPVDLPGDAAAPSGARCSDGSCVGGDSPPGQRQHADPRSGLAVLLGESRRELPKSRAKRAAAASAGRFVLFMTPALISPNFQPWERVGVVGHRVGADRCAVIKVGPQRSAHRWL